MEILVAFVSMFASMFLSGFRSRSIAANLKGQASLSGALQTAGELVALTALVKSPTVGVIASATIASFLGYYSSMMFHDMVNKRRHKLEKKQHKQWVDHRIEKAFKKRLKLSRADLIQKGYIVVEIPMEFDEVWDGPHATFSWQLLDAKGKLLAQQQVFAFDTEDEAWEDARAHSLT